MMIIVCKYMCSIVLYTTHALKVSKYCVYLSLVQYYSTVQSEIDR